MAETTHARPGRRTKLSELTEQERELCFAMAGQGSSNAAILGSFMSDRTIRDLVARYEGRHPTRKSSPQIDAFFDELYAQRAMFRAATEIEVAKIDPKTWLKYMARSRPGLEGWSELVAERVAAPRAPSSIEQSPEELRETVATLAASLGIVADCGHRGCPDCSENVEVQDEQG